MCLGALTLTVDSGSYHELSLLGEYFWDVAIFFSFTMYMSQQQNNIRPSMATSMEK